MSAANFLLYLIFGVIIIGPGISLPISITFFILVIFFILRREQLTNMKVIDIFFLIVLIGLAVINYRNSHFILTLIPALLLSIEFRRYQKEENTFFIPQILSFVTGVVLNLLLLFHSLVSDEVRTGLGGDVNYDSFTVYIWLVASTQLVRQKLLSSFPLKLLITLTVVHTAIVTQSKMFISMIICLIISEVLIKITKKYRIIRLVGKFIQHRNLLFTVCLFFGVIGLSFVIVEIGYVSTADAMSVLDRLNNFNDEGVYGRATANIFWFKQFISYDIPLVTGFSLLEMQEQYPLIPHNSYIFAVIYAGFVHTAIVVVMLSKILRLLRFEDFVRIFPGYMVLTNTIHGIFSPIFLCMLFYWFLLKRVDFKK